MEIERIETIELAAFKNQYFIPNLPVILTKYVKDWPALTKWKNLKYFDEEYGHRTVPIEVGRIGEVGWKEEAVTISKFVHQYMISTQSGVRAYLAQHELFGLMQY